MGSGSDRETKRKVSKDEAIDFCNKHNYKYFECSALTGYNIHEMFSCMARDIIEREIHLYTKKKLVKKNNSNCIIF